MQTIQSNRMYGIDYKLIEKKGFQYALYPNVHVYSHIKHVEAN